MFDPFGQISPPPALNTGRFAGGVAGGAVGALLNLLVNVMVTFAGIYALFNFVLAGYAFMSAGGDSKKVEAAWAKIYQTIIGLMFAVGSFTIAAIVGALLYNDWSALIIPRIN